MSMSCDLMVLLHPLAAKNGHIASIAEAKSVAVLYIDNNIIKFTLNTLTYQYLVFLFLQCQQNNIIIINPLHDEEVFLH